MNREAERKRLVELIENFFEKEIGASFVKGFLDKFADNILDDGWMRPPVKVGQKLYLISDGLYWEAEVIRVVIRQGEGVDPCIVFVRLKDGNIKAILDIYNDISKTVFTSREDALKALEGKEDEGK